MKVNKQNLTPDEELYLKAKEKYAAGMPIMSDVEFDILEDKLHSDDSFIINMVGTKKGPKVDTPHLTPMLSLAKIKFKNNLVPIDEFNYFFKDISKNELIEYGPKLDGNAINCVYQNGKLISIQSRGDGTLGQNYTKQLSNKVPQIIKGFTGEIRGEAVVDMYIFETKYKKDSLVDIDLNKKYCNARNFVAGILNKDFDKSNIDKYNDIDFIAFDIKTDDIIDDTNKWLISKGFDILDKLIIKSLSEIDTESNLLNLYKDFDTYRKKCKYQLDGIVAKLINKNLVSELGETSHHPNWALAIKFIAQEVTTKIIDIEWNLTKRGELAPVAILEPIELMDSIVKRASVYNASWMIANKCYPGAEVTLIKSGDIIPVITEITKPSELTYKLMTEWNGKKVSFNDVNLIVEGFEDTNEYKSIQMYHAISSLGFKNIGPATCELLVNTDISLFDLLQQTPDAIRMNLINSKQFKDGRELELLIENLYALNSVEMWQIIYSFGWRNCGKTISKQLANYVCGISYDFKGLEKVVVEGFINSQDKQNKVKEMENILTKNNIKVNKPKSLQGLITYCMTGSPTTHPTKEQYKFDIESSGKCIESSLKSDTMYLVTNSLGSMTGKMLKAEKNGTKILDYQQFLDLIKEL